MTDTKKVKKKIDKKKLWNSFDNEIKTNLECVYKKSDENVCECCNSILVFTEEGFLGCTNNKCGILYRDIADFNAEWRYYGSSDNKTSDPTRCGMPINPLLRESSFGCKVVLSRNSSYEMRKIRRFTEWQSMPYREKSQYDEFQKITVYANQAGISKIIIDDAMRYHKKISETKTFRGLNRDGIIAASIYVASRINNNPRTAKEIATIFNLDNTSTTRGCKNAISIINELERDMNKNEKPCCVIQPLNHLLRDIVVN